MKKLKNLKTILKRVVLSVFVIVLIVTLPSVGFYKDDNFERIYKAFLGSKSNFQGVIEIWNIDTFEGGNESKSAILKKVASDFQKKNKGVYVMIRNMSEQECLNLIASGTFPDLFSCSFGVSKEIEEYVQAFNDVDVSVIEESARGAGQKNDKQYGVAWCKVSYFLISTGDKLNKAKVENFENVKLSSILLTSGYEVQEKKDTKTVYSVSMGSSKYLIPQNIIRTYNKEEGNLISDKAFNRELSSQTQYSAYCNFIASNSTILLGSQRDVFRMENRVKQGKVTDALYEQVTAYSDLIQFMFLSKHTQKEKVVYAEKFVQDLILEKSQNQVLKGGLLSINGSDFENKEGAMQNIILHNFSDYATLNVFIDKSEIQKLQQI